MSEFSSNKALLCDPKGCPMLCGKRERGVGQGAGRQGLCSGLHHGLGQWSSHLSRQQIHLRAAVGRENLRL